MITIKQDLVDWVTEAIGRCGWETSLPVTLERPGSFEHGDYATNWPLVASRQLKKSPLDLAEDLVVKLRAKSLVAVIKVTVAAPGFVNFYLSPVFWEKSLIAAVAAGADYGRATSLAGQKILIEYTDPNPFKELHLGHLMSNTIGEALARLHEAAGGEVKRACYQGDVGLHVAKAVWGMTKQGVKQTDAAAMRQLGLAYAAGARAYDEDAAARAEIERLNRSIYDRSDAEVNKRYDWGRQVSLDYFEKIYSRLGTKFDFYFFESVTAKLGQKLVEENIDKVFERSDGAVIFRGETHGLHTRVFLNRDGLPTYEAKELGLAPLKYEQYPYDQSLILTANEVSEYFKVLLAALKLIFPDLAAKTKHISHGLLRLTTGKMSSRTGQVLAAEAVLDELTERARAKIGVRTVSDPFIVADRIAVAAIKYSILKQSPGRDIIFDPSQALSFEGDSGPYLQYTLVRARSVLTKAMISTTDVKRPADELPSRLERLVHVFPEAIDGAVINLAPHSLLGYLTDMAGAFNAYYAERPILAAGVSAAYRLQLTAVTAHILESGLTWLGLPTVDRM